jgi:hypothetical protein
VRAGEAFLLFKDLVQDAGDIEELDELEAPPPAAA